MEIGPIPAPNSRFECRSGRISLREVKRFISLSRRLESRYEPSGEI
jgi:hypothetical protein